eukprot:5574578-Prymnesium_polylepis.1
MVECFIQVGLAKIPQLNEFKKYVNHRCGTLSGNLKDLTGAPDSEESVSFGEVVAEVEMLQRNGACEDEDLEAGL